VWCRNGCLEPLELATFLRRMISGLQQRELSFLLVHLAGVCVVVVCVLGGGDVLSSNVCCLLCNLSSWLPCS
jgi:hypothetical protein